MSLGELMCVLVKRHYAILIKESIHLGLAYNFRDLVQCHSDREHGGVQAGMVLENS